MPKLNLLILALLVMMLTSCNNSGGVANSGQINDSGRSPYTFVCEADQKPPTTFAITAKGERRPFIRWESDFFNQPITKDKYPPERRCQEVTNRMNEYITDPNNNFTPRQITHGIMNNEPVICVTDNKGEDCKGLLYTLKKNVQDPDQVLREFLKLNKGQFNGNPLVESPSCRTYIDIKAMIEGTLKTAEVICKEQK